MIVQSIVIWLITEEQEVLLKPLKQKKAEKYGENVYQPFKGWVGYTESLLGRIARLMKEEFGEYFAKNYPYEKLSQIKEVRFPLSKGAAMCLHFLGRVTNAQLDIIDPSLREKIRFVERENSPEIKMLGMKSESSDIVLFKDDYKIIKWFFSILEKQTVSPISPFFIF